MSNVDVLAELDRWYAMTQAGANGDAWECDDVNIQAVRSAIDKLIDAASIVTHSGVVSWPEETLHEVPRRDMARLIEALAEVSP